MAKARRPKGLKSKDGMYADTMSVNVADIYGDQRVYIGADTAGGYDHAQIALTKAQVLRLAPFIAKAAKWLKDQK